VDSLALIPYPQHLEIYNASFLLDESIIVSAHPKLKGAFKLLQNELEKSWNKKISIKTLESNELSPENNIQLLFDASLDKEEYNLNIGEQGIQLSASFPVGAFWGVQSLKQLMVSNYTEENNSYTLPCLSIQDKPAFEHRGMLLDVCRHFFDKEVVKKYIDLLAFYKMNTLHWHLTEDQGWRIEIKKYPKLTEIGAWRTDTSGNKYGGFYTQDDIREIVQYAEARHITVIPEIELPGHAQAALAAYPQYSCIEKGIEVVNDWGVFKEIYCAGNDSTFLFLENILTEVMELFPSEYIHIGGDEAPKFRWEHCAKCQKRIEEEGLHDEHELQSYFITRIEKFLNQNGRKLIGWDEILEGGLSPNATVQSWRGMDNGIEAAHQNHQVIMSPTSHCYFDYDLKAIDLEKVYQFNPIPEGLDADKVHLIKGGECNLWTEHIPNEANLDRKTFPRMLAMSEVLWTYPEKRSFEPFLERVRHQYNYLKNEGVKYGLEGEAVRLKSNNKDGQIYVELKPGVPGLDLKYAYVSDTFIKYEEPIVINKTASLKVQAYRNNTTYGDVFEQSFVHHNALGLKPIYLSSYNKWYTAGGEYGLTDGFKGSIDFRDGHWQGFWGEDMDVIIDLKKPSTLQNIQAGFYQYNNAWIFFPEVVEVFSSIDSLVWESIGTTMLHTAPEKRGKFTETVQFDIQENSKAARYIRFKAKNVGTVPSWHEAAGSDAWIFVDEISIETDDL
jgi:hexosaminidase